MVMLVCQPIDAMTLKDGVQPIYNVKLAMKSSRFNINKGFTSVVNTNTRVPNDTVQRYAPFGLRPMTVPLRLRLFEIFSVAVR